MKNDYMLDMVEAFGKNLGKSVCDKKEEIEPIVIENMSDKDIMLVILRKMVHDENFDKAENTLFEFLEEDKSNDMKEIGVWFYNELSLKSDEILKKNSFNREEIKKGLKDFLKNFNK